MTLIIRAAVFLSTTIALIAATESCRAAKAVQTVVITRTQGMTEMGWEPITSCRECGEPFDGYVAPNDRLCECCLEILRIDMEQAQDRYKEALEKAHHEPR